MRSKPAYTGQSYVLNAGQLRANLKMFGNLDARLTLHVYVS